MELERKILNEMISASKRNFTFRCDNEKEVGKMIGKEKKKKIKRQVKKSAKETKLKSGDRKVEFKLYALEAKQVSLAGEFNNWDTEALPMKKSKDGMWKAKITLSPGRYEYRFFVDGTWAQDISDVELTPNPFGTHNIVLKVD
jgi:1,4-alpha-glucan branching enzyme